jgi:hypothetical protein
MVASAAFAIMISLAAPAAAQRGREGKEQRGRSAPQGERAGQARARSAPPEVRPQAPPPQQARAQQQQAPPPQERPAQVQRQAPPPVNYGRAQDSRQAPPANYGPTQYSRQAPPPVNYGRAQDSRQAPPANYGPAQDSRQAPQARYDDGPRNSYPATRSYQPRAVPYSNYYGWSHEVRRPVFVQPYYTFRPRFTLGFGIQVGYGVAYPFRYYDPYAFYNFRIGVVRGYGVTDYSYRVGGLSFNIDPDDAAVFIDGEYVGVAEDFSAGQMPLTLAVGRHRVELSAQGFMPVSFDITIVPGQVIPYSGTLPYTR